MRDKKRFPQFRSRIKNLRDDGWPCESLPQAQTLSEILKEAPPERAYILPGLIARGETTLVHVAPGIVSDIFALLCAYSCAYRKMFAPHGIGTGEAVLQCGGRGHERTEYKNRQLVSQRDPGAHYETDEGEYFKFQPRFHADGTPVNLCSKTDQELFLEAIPEETKLVVFQEIEAWFSSKVENGTSDAANVFALLDELNERGIAVLAFSRPKKKSIQLDFTDQRKQPNLVWLTRDEAAPTEIGGGFCVSRQKMDEEDPVPAKYRFWYSIVNGKLEWGWSFYTEVTANEAKQLAIQERRIKVAKLVADGMPQKDISGILKVDAATISRDVAKIKATGTLAQKNLAEDDDESGAAS